MKTNTALKEYDKNLDLSHSSFLQFASKTAYSKKVKTKTEEHLGARWRNQVTGTRASLVPRLLVGEARTWLTTSLNWKLLNYKHVTSQL